MLERNEYAIDVNAKERTLHGLQDRTTKLAETVEKSLSLIEVLFKKLKYLRTPENTLVEGVMGTIKEPEPHSPCINNLDKVIARARYLNDKIAALEHSLEV